MPFMFSSFVARNELCHEQHESNAIFLWCGPQFENEKIA